MADGGMGSTRASNTATVGSVIVVLTAPPAAAALDRVLREARRV